MTKTCKRNMSVARGSFRRRRSRKLLSLMALGAFLAITPNPTFADAHGLAMQGGPQLASDYKHLPYANPAAPQGGSITFGEVGSFDSLNPFIIKGDYPWEVRIQTFESLLGRNYDEPFALYPLLAETVETPPDRSWVAFTLNPAARFSDGTPVTVDDVIFSMEILAEKGRPSYRNTWRKVGRVERIGARVVKFHFDEPDREAPLILGLMPILKQAEWEGRDFAETTLTPVTGTGAYVVAEIDAGRSVILRRDPDYWGAEHPFNAGRNNLDEIRIEYFRDGAALFEAFRAGEISVYREGDAQRWREGYGFAEARGLTLSEIPHRRPTGMKGFVFNTRNPIFADRRVREALTLAFDFEWINRTLLGGDFQRIPSYFGNSPLAHDGPAEGAEAALLAPFAADLPPGTLDATVAQPKTAGEGRNRRGLRAASRLLEDAGWTVVEGRRVNADGTPLAFEILLRSSVNEKIAGVYADALARLGVEANVRLVDSAQYQSRRNAYDFDMIVNQWSLSLSPGAEQEFYWHSSGRVQEGTRNYMGAESPAVDAMIAALIEAENGDQFTAAVRALDRVLTAERYVVPFWYSAVSRIAHEKTLKFPDHISLYGDWPGFLPDVWWRSADQ